MAQRKAEMDKVQHNDVKGLFVRMCFDEMRRLEISIRMSDQPANLEAKKLNSEFYNNKTFFKQGTTCIQINQLQLDAFKQFCGYY